MDTAAICSVEALDLAELLAFPHLIGGAGMLLAEAGARRATGGGGCPVRPAFDLGARDPPTATAALVVDQSVER